MDGDTGTETGTDSEDSMREIRTHARAHDDIHAHMQIHHHARARVHDVKKEVFFQSCPHSLPRHVFS